MSSQGINDLYNLPPIPPRSVFSSRSASRVRFPDFNSPSYRLPNGLKPSSPAVAARLFVKNLFYYGEHWSSRTFIQFKICAALAACLFVLFCWVLLSRIRKRIFWIFRLVKRPNGILIAPNATVGFTFFEGIYAAALIAFLFEFSRFESGKLPVGTLIWALLAWSPLIAGAFFGLLGTIYALPAPKSKRSRIWKALTPRPLFINLICLAIPTIQITTIVIPAVTSNSIYYRGLGRFREWDEMYSSETEISQEMLEGALEIWRELLDAYFILVSGFVIWSCWALLITFAYGFCGISLLKAIGDQIRNLREVGVEDSSCVSLSPTVPMTPFSPSSRTLPGSPAVKTPNLDPKWSNEALVSGRLERNSSLKSTGATDDLEAQGKYTTPSPNPKRGSLRSLSRIDTNSRTALTGLTEMEDEDFTSPGPDQPASEYNNADLIFSDRELVEDLPHKSFFPPMRPSAFKSFRRQPDPSNSNSSSWNRFRNKERGEKNNRKPKKSEVQARFLEKVYYSFLISFCAKWGAEMAFSGVALYLTFEIYAAAEQNTIGDIVEKAVLWAAWATFPFGSITLAIIFWRSYEPATQAFLLVSEQNRSKKVSSSESSESKRSTSFPRIGRSVSRSFSNRSKPRSSFNSSLKPEVVELSPAPVGSLAERRINRGRNLGLGIDDDGPLAFSNEAQANNFVIRQTVEQTEEPGSSPTKSSLLTSNYAHSRLDSASTAFSAGTDELKGEGSLSSTQILSSKSPSSTAFLPSSPWSPWSFSDPQSPSNFNPSTPSPAAINAHRSFAPFEDRLDMTPLETTFPSGGSPLVNSPIRSVMRQNSSHSSTKSAPSPFRSDGKLPWTPPAEWGSPPPDDELVAEQQRREKERTT